MTPPFFVRIDLILEAEPQEEQPGIVNCTTLSSAITTPAETDKKTRAKKTLNIFFISDSPILFLFYNLRQTPSRCNHNLQLTGHVLFGIEDKNTNSQERKLMTIALSTPFILASASPRRQELLRSVGLKFQIIPGHVNEDQLQDESPRAHVKRLSRDKAMVIANQYPQALVLGADTIVVIDNLILGKPKNKKQAREMIERLNGRKHTVFTGFTIAHIVAGVCKTKVVQSAVQFKTISHEEMDWYVNCDEPYDKAGGYAVQGKGAYFIKAIHGSYTNVIGLPLCEVLEEFKTLGTIHFK
jgi:septum formation protein